MAEAAVNLKEAAFSARLLGALQGLRASAEALWDEITPADFERLTAAVRSQLDEADFQSAWNEGSSFTIDEAVAYALEEHE